MPEPDLEAVNAHVRGALSRLAWKMFDAVIYFAEAAITVALHVGLMLLTFVSGSVVQELIVDAIAEMEGTSRLASAVEAGTNSAVLAAAAILGVLGPLKVVRRAIGDWKE